MSSPTFLQFHDIILVFLLPGRFYNCCMNDK